MNRPPVNLICTHTYENVDDKIQKKYIIHTHTHTSAANDDDTMFD